MALVFDTDLSTASLLYAFNNNIVKFKSDTAGVTQVKAEILTNGNTYTIYPDGAGFFWFNFKGIKSIELNVDNYADMVSPDLDTTFVYDWSGKAILSESITFKIYFSTGSPETATRSITWLNGYVNLVEFKQKYPALVLDYNAFLLKPLPLVKYWPGLPFDISFYANPAANFKVENNNAGIDYTFTNTSKVPRLFFSDGRLDISIEDLIPFTDGFNDVTITSGTNNVNFLVEKVTTYCEGHYLKWLNSFGGWSYWLFYRGNENITTTELGVINNDFYNLEDTVSPFISLGKNSGNSITVFQDGITKDERELLRDLLDSVKVYFFTGVAFSQSSDKDWVEVNISGGQFRLTNAREMMNTLTMTIDLPENVTRKL